MELPRGRLDGHLWSSRDWSGDIGVGVIIIEMKPRGRVVALRDGMVRVERRGPKLSPSFMGEKSDWPSLSPVSWG